MKKKTKITNGTNSNTQNVAGYITENKETKALKFTQYRAIVFERQMSDNYEIIF